MSHVPLTVNKFKTGLVQYQPNQVLNNDAFPVLQNAFTYRNTVKRRLGFQTIGQLSRTLTAASLGMSMAGPWTFFIYSQLAIPITGEPNAQIDPGSVVISIATMTTSFADLGNGNFGYQGAITAIPNSGFGGPTIITIDNNFSMGDSVLIQGVGGMTQINSATPYVISSANSTSITIPVDSSSFGAYTMGGTATDLTMNAGSINYATGAVSLNNTDGGGNAATITFTYYPMLPSMGIFDRNDVVFNVQNVFMDTKYTYRYVPSVGFQQFPTGAVWDLDDWNLPSFQNYFVDSGNNPIFWITNVQGQSGIPIQYTNGLSSAVWYPFNPTIDSTDTSPPVIGGVNRLWEAKFLIPFRGRLFAFNTWEGTTLAAATNFRGRIRCSAITTPFTYTSAIVTTVVPNAWNDAIPGKGFAQDLPTNESIVGAWQVMNQIIVKSSRKTYVITETGTPSFPFKIDLLDDNQGSTSGFSAANMGSHITDVGNRSVNETSPTSLRTIDEKILGFPFTINKAEHGFDRVYGIRDFITRTNSFIYPYEAEDQNPITYPNRRLIYNYDNGSYAIYEDSLTCLGYFRENMAKTWAESSETWAEANFAWNQNTTNEPFVAGGNQQGFIGILDSTIEEGPSLAITNINPNGGAMAAIFTSPSNNMEDGTIIFLSGILGPMSSLNGTVGAIQSIDENTFYIFTYDPATDEFRFPVIISSADTYIGGGLIQVRYNFEIQTKAFNFLEEGQSMHISYLDTLVNTNPGVLIQLSVYASLDNSSPVNLKPENTNTDTIFGNMISLSNPTTYQLSEINNRALVNQRANMLTLGFSLSNATMASDNFLTPFVLSSFTVWMRRAGRPLSPLGGG